VATGTASDRCVIGNPADCVRAIQAIHGEAYLEVESAVVGDRDTNVPCCEETVDTERAESISVAAMRDIVAFLMYREGIQSTAEATGWGGRDERRSAGAHGRRKDKGDSCNKYRC